MSGGCVYNQKPLDGVEVKITSEGLIKLTGPMIASGYLSQGGQLASVGSDDWFESSDVGELSNGFLKVNGRSDEVIISGGENISLTLVEEKIRGLLPNLEVIAFALPDEVWGEKLCIGSTSKLSIEEIKKSIGSLLSPKEVFLFEQIPTTSIGKPDRRAAKNLALKITGGN